MKNKKTSGKLIIVMMLCLSLVCGCGKNAAKEGENGENAQNTGDRTYQQRDRESLSVDYAEVDALDDLKNSAGVVIDATYKEKLEDRKTNAELPDGAKTDYTFGQYSFSLNSVLVNNGNLNIGKDFILGVGEIVKDTFPELQEGDRIITAVKKAEYDDNSYNWDSFVLFYVKNDGTVVSAYTEDSKYDGYTLEEFKDMLTKN